MTTRYADFLRLLEEHLDDDFVVLFAPEPPPPPGVIAAFGAQIGCALPDDFTALLGSEANGLYVEAKETAWPRRQGGRFWMLQHALLTFGLDGGLPDWVELRAEVARFRAQTQTTLTPCMRTIGSNDPYCFDGGGALLRWDHEERRSAPVGTSFFEALAEELRTLRANKDRLSGSG